ncbi:MAG: hypothetical protein ACKOFX_07570 [Solirubrobacterales bacterium]
MIEVLLLLAGVVLVLLCGLFVAAEFSFVTVDRIAVERDAEEGDRTATGLKRALETSRPSFRPHRSGSLSPTSESGSWPSQR